MKVKTTGTTAKCNTNNHNHNNFPPCGHNRWLNSFGWPQSVVSHESKESETELK